MPGIFRAGACEKQANECDFDPKRISKRTRQRDAGTGGAP